MLLILGKSLSSTLTEKGCVSIKKASEARKDGIQLLPGQEVRQDYRQKYLTLNKLPNASSNVRLKMHLHLRGKFFDQLMRSLASTRAALFTAN